MPILFSAVAHEKCVLAKYASCDGNFVEIVEQVVAKIPTVDSKMTYSHGHYLFHYVAENQHLYFCITAKYISVISICLRTVYPKSASKQSCQRSRAFLFLNEIKRRFTLSTKGFSDVLAAEMQRYSEDYNTITIRKGELDELNSIGVGSSETILGEKILFVNNPDNLNFSTISYVGETPKQIVVTENTTSARASSALVKEENTRNSKFRFVIISGILVLLWLAISSLGPTSFVIIACILVLSIVPFSKKDKS